MKKIGESWLKGPEKRSMDVMIAASALPLSSLAGVCAGAALFLETPTRAPLFWQERIGRLPQEPLAVPKLRTLYGEVTNQHSFGFNHPSATKVGRVVRALHIDEAPQLSLVLFDGSMSVVGPRPIVRDTFEQTMDTLSPSEQAEYLRAREIAKPGIVAPDSHLQHKVDGNFGEVYESALATIEYAHTASLATDIRLMAQVAESLISKTPEAGEKAPRYHTNNGTVLVKAAMSFGVSINQEVIDYFFACSRLASVADDFVDKGEIPTQQEMEAFLQKIFSEGIGTVGKFTTKENERIDAAIAQWSPRTLTTWLEAKSLPEHARQKQQASTISELKLALVNEAKLFHAIFSLPLESTDNEARQRFNHWLEHFSRGGYFVDTAADMPRDYLQGELTLAPTIWHRMHLLQSGLREGFAGLRGINLNTGRALGKTALLTLREGGR